MRVRVRIVFFVSLLLAVLALCSDSLLGQTVRNGVIRMPEITAGASPPANQLDIYTCDDGGTTKLCSKDSAGAVSMGLGGGGGGGATIYHSTFATRETSFAAGSMWLNADTGSAYTSYATAINTWTDFWSGMPATMPPSTGWTWDNQDAATVSHTTGAMTIVGDETNATSNEISVRHRAAPSVPYTITARVIIDLGVENNDASVGIGWRQSSDGKIAGLRYQIRSIASGLRNLNSTKWTSSTVISANYVSTTNGSTQTEMCWKIADNNTNRIISISKNCKDYEVFHSVVRTDFLTGDQVMAFVDSGGTTAASDYASLTIVSWLVE